MFINDNYPRSVNSDGNLEGESDWLDRFVKTKVGDNVTIGSNSTILGGLSIGSGSIIGAGSTVTKDIPENVICAGNPAKIIRKIN